MNQVYTGRSKCRCDVQVRSGRLLIAVRCQIGGAGDEDLALVDTASEWCVLSPPVALDLGYDLETGGETLLHTRFGLLAGELIRMPVRFLADEGQPAEVEATWFLSPDWPGPVVIGWKGGLERMRFAFDPRESDFYFAEY